MLFQTQFIIHNCLHIFCKYLSFLLFLFIFTTSGFVYAAISIPADFNGDGYEDLAVGVPREDVGAIVDAGAVHVFYGSSVGVQGNNQIWHLNSAGVLLAATTGDQLGSALATGDFNNDGYADLAIGIPFKDNSMGQVIVLYGSAGGLRATGNQVWNQDNLADTREQGDQFGSALTAGDFNADGYSDLAIGVPKEDFPDLGVPGTGVPKCGICLDAGIVNLVNGGPSGLTAAGNALTRTLKVFVSVKNSRGLLEARLSDGSSPVYSTFIDEPADRSSHIITLNYQAASAGQKLIVRYTVDTKYLPGWISLDSAALQ